MVKNPNKDSEQLQKLSILIARDGLYFYGSLQNKVTEFHKKEFSDPQSPENLVRELQRFFADSSGKQLVSAAPKVNVTYSHPLYTLVPRAHFQKERLSDYLKYNVRLLPTDELSYDQLDNREINLVYVPFTNINNFLFDQFGTFSYHHFATFFIDECVNLNDPEIQQVFIRIFPTHFVLAAFEEGKLLLCNSFDYFAPEDLVYYVLFVLEQLKFDPETLDLKLSGAIQEDTVAFELLYTYVRFVSFLEVDTSLKITDKKLKGSPSHKHHFMLAHL